MTTILVVQGAEYQAVCRGLRRVGANPQVIALPIGPTAVQEFLQAQQQQGLIAVRSQILVMGLCGSLQPGYQIGDVAVYQQVLSLTPQGIKFDRCDSKLTALLQQKLGLQKWVNAWTSDRFIHAIQTKQQLYQQYGVDVVDMEGSAILTALKDIEATIAMVRVISDSYCDELPDLSFAISSTGNLIPTALLFAMLRQPIAAWRLIRGIRTGLRVLEDITGQIFTEAVGNS